MEELKLSRVVHFQHRRRSTLMQVNAAVETVLYPQSSHVPIETPVRKCVPGCGCAFGFCAALRSDQPLNTLRFTDSVVFTPPECRLLFPRPAGYPIITAAEPLLPLYSSLDWAISLPFLRPPAQAKTCNPRSQVASRDARKAATIVERAP